MIEPFDEWGPRVVRLDPPHDVPFVVLGEDGEIWYRVDADDIEMVTDYQLETMLDNEPHVKPFHINSTILERFPGLQSFVLGLIEVSDDGEYRILRDLRKRSPLTREQAESVKLSAARNDGIEHLSRLGLPDTPEVMEEAAWLYKQTRKSVERMAAKGIQWYLPFH